MNHTDHLRIAVGAVAAALTATACVAVQGTRAWAERRRISWSPGFGALYNGALHARTLGDGASGVVLLHGLGGSNAFWGSAYDTLAGTGRLVVPDLLGFGASPRPPGAYTTDDHVQALTALLDELDITGPIVVGAHSLGCLIALALAERRPNLVAGVVAFCPPLYPDEATARARLARVGVLERQLANDSPWAETICRWSCRHPRAVVAVAAAIRPGLPAVFRRDAFRHNWTSFSQTFRHVLAAAEGGRWLAQVQVPVELVAGTEDPIIDLGYLRGLADGLPHVTLRVRPGADHDLPLTDPGDAVAALNRAALAPSRPVAGRQSDRCEFEMNREGKGRTAPGRGTNGPGTEGGTGSPSWYAQCDQDAARQEQLHAHPPRPGPVGPRRAS